MCHGHHSTYTETSVPWSSELCGPCGPFEILCNDFHVQDSDKSQSEGAPLALLQWAVPNFFCYGNFVCDIH